MKRATTMQDIADHLGVTKVTVSKALNNRSGVGGDLRRRILATASEMGYSMKERGGARDKNWRFAYIFPKRYFLDDEAFYTSIYYHINDYHVKHGHFISCFTIDSDDEMSATLPPGLLTQTFSGIYISGELAPGFLKACGSLNGYKVAIDFYAADLEMDCIITDNYYAGYFLTDYLIKKGHRKIGFVGDVFSTTSISDRYFGYLKALTRSRLPIREDWCFSIIDPLTGVPLSDPPLPMDSPTAYVCHCDKAAYLLAQRMTALGIRVPDDVSVASFDNTKLCELMTPRLTSINIDREKIASRSINRMLSRLRDPELHAENTYLATTLIERESVAPPKGGSEA